MRKRIDLKNVTIDNQELILDAEDIDIKFENVRPGERILVDSDHYTFIYILESEEDFIYVNLPYTMWAELKEAMDNKLDVTLLVNGHKFVLKGIYSELQYLIENIKGNSNYGEEMVKKVESVFLVIQE